MHSVFWKALTGFFSFLGALFKDLSDRRIIELGKRRQQDEQEEANRRVEDEIKEIQDSVPRNKPNDIIDRL